MLSLTVNSACPRLCTVYTPVYIYLLQIKYVSLHFQVVTVRTVTMKILSYLQKQFNFVGVTPKPIFSWLYFECFGVICRSSLSRHYSSSSVRRGVGRYVQTRLQRLNSKYERFLKMRFPRFYQLYHTFMEGESSVYFHMRPFTANISLVLTLCSLVMLLLFDSKWTVSTI